MVVSAFEKAVEMESFYHSIQDSDIRDIPKITVVNTDHSCGLTGKGNVDVAQKYRKPNDRIFVCTKNLYTASFRYIITNVLTTEYKYIIATESDFWFEKPLEFRKHIDYIRQDSNIAIINALVRHVTKEWQDKTNQMYFRDHPHKVVDGYLNLCCNVPWHMVLTRTQSLMAFFQQVHNEIEDHSYTRFCRGHNNLVLTTDCRDFAVHQDRIATIRKYPYFAKLYGPNLKKRRRTVKKRYFQEIQ